MNDMAPTSTETSYTFGLQRVAFWGGLIGAVFEAFFALFYWIGRQPLILAGICLAALAVDLVGFWLVTRARRPFAGAQLITAALMLALVGVSLLTGGIDSSSIVWLALPPVVAALMTGRPSGVVWGGISAAVALGMYALNHWLRIDLSLISPTQSDRVFDLVLLIVGITAATALNENIKAHIMHRMDLTQDILEEQANLDPLTCAYNRRYLYSYVQNIFSQKEKSGAEISLLMIDIDFFKSFNDAHGHPAADQILCEFVRAVAALLKEPQILARYGGDEFVVALPYTNEKKALKIAEELRAVIEKTALETVFGDYPITISIGVASGRIKNFSSVEALIDAADAALYQAKKAGRNRVHAR